MQLASLRPIDQSNHGNFETTFLGIGIINNTIRYNDNGTGIYITNSEKTVYQIGITEEQKII